MSSDVLEDGNLQPNGPTRADDPLDATPPLFDEPELVEDTTDDPLPELRNAAENLFYRRSERDQARILELETLVEDVKTDWTA